MLEQGEMRPAGVQRVLDYITAQIMLDSAKHMCYDDHGLAKLYLESAMLDLALPGHEPGHEHAASRRPYAGTPSWGMNELGFLPMHCVHCVAVTSE